LGRLSRVFLPLTSNTDDFARFSGIIAIAPLQAEAS
jgi:hypothetical protein